MDEMATPSSRSSRLAVHVVGREAAGVSAAFRLEHLCLFLRPRRCSGFRRRVFARCYGAAVRGVVLRGLASIVVEAMLGCSRGRPVELHRGVVHTFDFLTSCEKTWRHSRFRQLAFGLSVVHNHVFERGALLLPELRDLQVLRSIDLRPLRIIEALGVLSEQDVQGVHEVAFIRRHCHPRHLSCRLCEEDRVAVDSRLANVFCRLSSAARGRSAAEADLLPAEATKRRQPMSRSTGIADEKLLAPDPIVIRDSIQRQLRGRPT